MKLLTALVIIGLFSPILYAQPTISFTFDDGVTTNMPGYSFEQWNKMLLDHLDDAGVRTVLFSMGHNKLDEKGQYLLKSWNDKGHKIGNHTFSHPNYHREDVTFEKFKEEFLVNDSIISKFSNYTRLFRFPFLKEGNTKEKIEQFRDLMTTHGYRNGHVTIDASDWYIDSRLRKRLRENPDADITGFRQFYLSHLTERAKYYEDLSFRLTGRHIKHTILLHHNLAAALFLGDLIKAFRSNGWNVIDADDAFTDPVFKLNPSNVPAGESLIWALARESGKFQDVLRYPADVLRYPAEDGEYERARMDKLGL
jgi:peptidoglycan-N-acetylglucosamine deacetylase